MNKLSDENQKTKSLNSRNTYVTVKVDDNKKNAKINKRAQY